MWKGGKMNQKYYEIQPLDIPIGSSKETLNFGWWMVGYIATIYNTTVVDKNSWLCWGCAAIQVHILQYLE